MRLLAGPASSGARDLVLAQLARARRRAGPARRAPRGKALHDFRVALRRLRTLLKAFRKPLSAFGDLESAGRRLRAAARLTNKARDAEVWTRTLLALAPGRPLPPEVAAALRGLARTGRAEAARGASRFAAAADELSRRLARAPRGPGKRRLGDAVSRLAGRSARRLAHRLEAARRERGGPRLHQARLSVKRLRYLLEPFAARAPGLPAVLSRLKALQRLLGEIHDLQGAEGFATSLPGGRELAIEAALERQDRSEDLLASWGRRRSRAAAAAWKDACGRLERAGSK